MKQLSYVLLLLLAAFTALVQAQAEPININSADANALMQLKGIGTKYAERIVQYRETNGPFATGGEVQNVRGVGPKIYQLNKDRIVVSDPVVE